MRRKWLRALPDAYLLNFFQLSHMVVLAGIVPWQIGMGAYGIFAATIALPSIAQSFFETFCLMAVYKHGRVDVIVQPIISVVVPLLAVFAVSFVLILDCHLALLSIALTIGLFLRSLAFALVVSQGGSTEILAKSELVTLAAYLAGLIICLVTGIRGAVVPMVMVTSACFVSSSYLLRYLTRNGMLTSEMLLVANSPKVSFSSSGRMMASRSFEEGVLTLSPLMLAVTVSPVAAGQFRVFVSAVKLMYKFFPFRHDLLFVEVLSHRRRFREIALVSIAVAGLSFVIAAGGALLVDLDRNWWVWPLIASLGAIVSSLALFPVSTDIDVRVLYLFTVGVAAMHTASSFGFVPFVLALLVLSVVVLAMSLVVLRRFLVPVT
jgi:hypothetical protein